MTRAFGAVLTPTFLIAASGAGLVLPGYGFLVGFEQILVGFLEVVVSEEAGAAGITRSVDGEWGGVSGFQD